MFYVKADLGPCFWAWSLTTSCFGVRGLFTLISVFVLFRVMLNSTRDELLSWWRLTVEDSGSRFFCVTLHPWTPCFSSRQFRPPPLSIREGMVQAANRWELLVHGGPRGDPAHSTRQKSPIASLCKSSTFPSSRFGNKPSKS